MHFPWLFQRPLICARECESQQIAMCFPRLLSFSRTLGHACLRFVPMRRRKKWCQTFVVLALKSIPCIPDLCFALFDDLEATRSGENIYKWRWPASRSLDMKYSCWAAESLGFLGHHNKVQPTLMHHQLIFLFILYGLSSLWGNKCY